MISGNTCFRDKAEFALLSPKITFVVAENRLNFEFGDSKFFLFNGKDN